MPPAVPTPSSTARRCTRHFFTEPDKKSTIYVGWQKGLPKRVITHSGNTIDCYDYGAHVAIALPSCGQ